jgi:uncharacterized protein (UPF0147 family)
MDDLDKKLNGLSTELKAISAKMDRLKAIVADPAIPLLVKRTAADWSRQLAKQARDIAESAMSLGRAEGGAK